MDGGKQQRAASIGAEVGQMTLPPLREIGPGYAKPREPAPDRCRLGRAGGGYVSIIRYNRNTTGRTMLACPPLFTVGLPFPNGFPPLSTSPHAHISISIS